MIKDCFQVQWTLNGLSSEKVKNKNTSFMKIRLDFQQINNLIFVKLKNKECKQNYLVTKTFVT